MNIAPSRRIRVNVPRCSCCEREQPIDELARNDGLCVQCRIDRETLTFELDEPPSIKPTLH